MCDPKQFHLHHGHKGFHHGCGCGTHIRRFFSKKEQQECLVKYQAQLENELTGVKERIQELKAD